MIFFGQNVDDSFLIFGFHIFLKYLKTDNILELNFVFAVIFTQSVHIVSTKKQFSAEEKSRKESRYENASKITFLAIQLVSRCVSRCSVKIQLTEAALTK